MKVIRIKNRDGLAITVKVSRDKVEIYREEELFYEFDEPEPIRGNLIYMALQSLNVNNIDIDRILKKL